MPRRGQTLSEEQKAKMRAGRLAKKQRTLLSKRSLPPPPPPPKQKTLTTVYAARNEMVKSNIASLNRDYKRCQEEKKIKIKEMKLCDSEQKKIINERAKLVRLAKKQGTYVKKTRQRKNLSLL